mmetsp:Transcript_64924/g.152715  ORF Transcript_64924/g.152715 Transcript_64924/m.152715 type:complete len:216 (+) Transcript_64924:1956-2603(+)
MFPQFLKLSEVHMSRVSTSDGLQGLLHRVCFCNISHLCEQCSEFLDIQNAVAVVVGGRKRLSEVLLVCLSVLLQEGHPLLPADRGVAEHVFYQFLHFSWSQHTTHVAEHQLQLLGRHFPVCVSVELDENAAALFIAPWKIQTSTVLFLLLPFQVLQEGLGHGSAANRLIVVVEQRQHHREGGHPSGESRAPLLHGDAPGFFLVAGIHQVVGVIGR